VKILIDIGHPGDFYVFKNFALRMQKNGHQILFTVREGEKESAHLDHYRFNYKIIGKKKASLAGKLSGIPKFTYQIFLISLKFRPTIFMSHGSIFAGITAFLLRKPHIALEDTGNMEQIRLSKPFSNVIVSPDVLPIDLGEKHIRYKGYHELAYLGPGYFHKNSDIYKNLGIPEGAPYAILRFVSWNASHDIGQKGLTDKDKIRLVDYLATKMNVFISAESKLVPELESYRINIPVTRMHDALAFATIYIGEGATMASEAGILGTPSVYISTIKISYTQDQENYGTVFNFTNFDDAFAMITKITSSTDFRKSVVNGKDRLLQEKIDVTAFFVWFVENYPVSAKIMKENPDFQKRFRF
jgi:uncharacterized protein